jgi:hypothetical protein
MTYPQFEGYSPLRPPAPPHPISTTVINSPFKGADTPKCQPKWGHFNPPGWWPLIIRRILLISCVPNRRTPIQPSPTGLA